MQNWTFQGKDITIDDFGTNISFVYLITNEATSKQYYGKKKLLFVSRKAVKNKKRKLKVVKPSDWLTYYGSNKELHADIEKYGIDKFSREVIRMCPSLSEANYWELWYQMIHHVLFHPDKYYNSYIGTRVGRKQLKIKE